MQRVSRIFQRRGLIALIVAGLPPPAPFKAFVLLGGITNVPIWQFTAAIAIGRGGRFLHRRAGRTGTGAECSTGLRSMAGPSGSRWRRSWLQARRRLGIGGLGAARL